MASSPEQQYLKSLLSHCGPDSLPYGKEVLDLITQHLLALRQDFPSLVILPAPFHDKDGTVLELLQADGTIPVTCVGSSYEIPITIWLLESYPVSSPLVIISSADDVSIKLNRRYCSKSGFVSLPYLDNWNFPHSNLSALAQNLRICFGRDAVHAFSSASTTSASPRSPHTPSSSKGIYSSTSASPSPSNPSTLLSSSPQNFSPSPSTCSLESSHRHPQLLRRQYPDASEGFRQHAIKALSERAKHGLEEHYRNRKADMEKLAAVETQLKNKHKLVTLSLDRKRNERDALEHNLQFVRTNTDVIEMWLAENRKFSMRDIDIDDAFAPCDMLSKQKLENLSADFALEDVLYSLDQTVQQGRLSMDAYLKHVRRIAHEQFFFRAAAMKVEEVQRQVQIRNMAARYRPP